MKKILSNIIFGIVICVFGYLSISNILHVIYLNKHDTFDFNSEQVTNIRTNMNELESNIDKISKLDNSVFTKDELVSIKGALNTTLGNIKTNKLLSYEGKQNIYFKDLLSIDLSNRLSATENISTLEMLARHDAFINNYLEAYRYDYISNAYNAEAGFQEVIQSYKYNTIDNFNIIISESNNARILARVYGLSDYVVKVNYLAKLVLEIGGANNE